MSKSHSLSISSIIHDPTQPDIDNNGQSTDTGQDLPTTVGPHVSNDICHQLLQTTYAMLASLTLYSVHTAQTQHEQTPYVAKQNKRIPTLVDTIKPYLCWSLFCTKTSKLSVTTDASLTDWGAHLFNHTVEGQWSPSESQATYKSSGTMSSLQCMHPFLTHDQE